MLVAAVLAGCGGGGEETVAPTTTSSTWRAEPAAVPAVNYDEIFDVDPAADIAHQIDQLTAAVFPIGDPNPDTTSLEWVNLAETACGRDPAGETLLGLALEHGWTIEVTGFVDASGPMGPGSINDSLDRDRAQATARLLAQACGLDPAVLTVNEGNVADDNVRKVVVAIHHVPEDQGATQ